MSKDKNENIQVQAGNMMNININTNQPDTVVVNKPEKKKVINPIPSNRNIRNVEHNKLEQY